MKEHVFKSILVWLLVRFETKQREYHRRWIHKRGRAIRRAYQKQWRAQHPEYIPAYRDKHRSAINSRERELYKLNRARRIKLASAKQKRKYHRDPVFRMRMAMYRFINKAVDRKKVTARCREIIGCQYDELKRHIESLFQDGMHWQNHGNGHGHWNIDHKLPISSFDLTDPAQVKACFHFSNLQPLWWIENQRKSNKIAPQYENVL